MIKMQAETSYPEIIGRVLEKERKDKGLGQKEIADHLGLTQSAWSRIERGQSGLSMPQLFEVGQLLGIEPNEIIQKADLAKRGLFEKGIKVNSEPSKDNTVALLSLAALSALVIAVLMKD